MRGMQTSLLELGYFTYFVIFWQLVLISIQGVRTFYSSTKNLVNFNDLNP